MPRARRGETDARVPGPLWSRNNMSVRRDRGPPSGGPHTLRSPRPGLPQTFIELAMLVLPVGGARLDRSTRLKPRNSQRFQLFYRFLISLYQPLQISLDAESFSLSSGADFSFELWMYRNTHTRTILPTLILILRPAHQTFLPETRAAAGRPVCAGLEPPPCSTYISSSAEDSRDPPPSARRSLILSPASTYNLLDNITNSCYKGT
jgi:hypothetical protein